MVAPVLIDNQLAVELRNVDIYYGSYQAVKGVSLPIERNKITAFIGPSGCGKSTVLRSINRMNDLVPGARVEGEVIYRGHNLYGHGVPEAESLPQEHLR